MDATAEAGVLVSIVTFNDERFLQRCLESVEGQTVPVRVKVFDNASHDRTREIAGRFPLQLHPSPDNLGFAAGHNFNLRDGVFDFALILNADVILEADFLERLIEAMNTVPGAGLAGGKLTRMDENGETLSESDGPVLDSTGIYFTPTQRHFDRGSGEVDRGQYEDRQLVFGISGAAMLLRRELLDDLGFGGEYFDEDFFAYREDADLSWRAQLRGWSAVYEPAARALHYRKVLPSRRRSLSPHINYHSVKNRYLMRIKNFDSAVRWRCFPHAYLRDLGILVYLLTLEWSSIPAISEVWRLRTKFRSKRRIIQENRRAAQDSIAKWFSFQPVAQPCERQAVSGEGER